jgi:hypothetical protein
VVELDRHERRQRIDVRRDKRDRALAWPGMSAETNARDSISDAPEIVANSEVCQTR